MVAALHAVVTNFRHGLARTSGSRIPSMPIMLTRTIWSGRPRSLPLPPPGIRGWRIMRSTCGGGGGEHRHHRAVGYGPAAGKVADRTTSQVVSIALFGMRMVAMARGRDEHGVLLSAFARLAEVCR
jgi:hypothetical protein